MTTSDTLVERALAIAGAFNVAEGVSDGKREYMVSVRLPGLDKWSIAHHKNPAVAMKMAVEQAEAQNEI